jgi:hypothetical protein
MRQQLHKSPSMADPPPNKEKRAKALAQKRNPTVESEIPIEITLARIIEEKPVRKEVEMFLQNECDKLTKQKMK